MKASPLKVRIGKPSFNLPPPVRSQGRGNQKCIIIMLVVLLVCRCRCRGEHNGVSGLAREGTGEILDPPLGHDATLPGDAPDHSCSRCM